MKALRKKWLYPIHIKEVKESFIVKYIYPWILVISVLVAGLLGAYINHLYWEKREHIERKSKILDEKIRSYLSISQYLFEFDAYTDLIMLRSTDIKSLKRRPQKDNEEEQRLKDLLQVSEDYQRRRLESMAGLRKEVSNAKLFFSAEVDSHIKKYAELLRQVEKGQTIWNRGTFNDLREKGIDLRTAMRNEIKKELHPTVKTNIGGANNAEK